MRRLRLRYRRWRYEREMRLPTPTSAHEPHRGRLWRTWRRVRHPVSAFRDTRDQRAISKPAPAPLTEQERMGNVFVRTYRRFRFRISLTRQGFTGWPRTAQALVCILAGLALAGTGLFAKRALLPSHSHRVNDVALFSNLGASVDQGTLKMLLFGDGTSKQLTESVGGNFEGDGIQAVGYSPYACGIGLDDRVVAGKVEPLPGVCKGWPAADASIAKAYQPDVVVLMTGTLEATGIRVNGKVRPVGSLLAEYRLDSELDRVRQAAGNAKFVIIAPICTQLKGGAIDYSRTWVKLAFRHYAAKHRGTTFADPASVLCPQGAIARDKKGASYVTGGFVTDAGSDAMWRWLATTAKHAEQQHS